MVKSQNIAGLRNITGGAVVWSPSSASRGSSMVCCEVRAILDNRHADHECSPRQLQRPDGGRGGHGLEAAVLLRHPERQWRLPCASPWRDWCEFVMSVTTQTRHLNRLGQFVMSGGWLLCRSCGCFCLVAEEFQFVCRVLFSLLSAAFRSGPAVGC